MKKMLVFLMMVVSLLAAAGCEELEARRIKTEGVVTHKHYQPYETVMYGYDMKLGPLYKTVIESWTVTIESEGLEMEVEGESFYESMEKGNKIPVDHVTYYNKEGEPKYEVLSLPEK